MLAARVIPKIAKNIITRNNSYGLGNATATPPTIRVSFAEKAGLGLLMTVSFLVIPAWVLTHMEKYKNHE